MIKKSLQVSNFFALLVVASGQIVSAQVAVAEQQFPEAISQVIAQNSTVVQVTDVSLNLADGELEIILDTLDNAILSVDTSLFRAEGDRLIAYIPNAVLALPDTQFFYAVNPTGDISQVRVIQFEPETIRITVVGQGALPTTNVSLRSGPFSYALNPEATAIESELIVTGQTETPYVARDATTATRTDTPLRDIPQSIQVIPQEVLEDQEVIRLNDALRNVSGVLQNSRDPRGARYQIRGFDESSVLRDGFRLTNASFGNSGFPELANIERIEVLKGAASILFGTLEPGGVINLVSEQPLKEPRVEIGVDLGNRNLFSSNLDFTGPITEDGGGTLSHQCPISHGR